MVPLFGIVLKSIRVPCARTETYPKIEKRMQLLFYKEIVSLLNNKNTFNFNFKYRTSGFHSQNIEL